MKAEEKNKEYNYFHRVVAPTATLFLIWLLLAGHHYWWLTLLGVVTSYALALLGARLGILDPGQHSIRFFFNAFTYVPWLIKEIVKSNIDVTKHIWKPQLDIKPKVFRTTADQITDKGLVLYANSITLTPGTISINSKPGMIEVHALDATGEDGLNEGEMNRRVAALEHTD